jgi:hypothetical protein
MNKYLLYLKKPKILGIILLVIVVIIAIVSIIISLKSKTSPPPPPTPPPCPGKQANYCPDGIHCADKCRVDQKWDCTSKACVCINSGFKSCNGNSECCSTCYPDDMCCTGPTQGTIKDPKTGNLIKICCPPDTTPGGTGEGCLSSNCGGIGTKPCDQGQACMKITGLTGSDFTDAVKHTRDDNTYRNDDGSSTLYLCANPISCGFSNPEYLPYHSDAASSYYNTSIMQDGDNICIPKDPAQYGSSDSVCYTSDQQSNCTDRSCEKKSSFDIFRGGGETGASTLGQHMKIIMGKEYKSEQGYYCDPGGGDPFLQYESIYGDGTCTWHDCQRELEEPGIARIQWDAISQKCSALKSNSGVGARGAVRCTGIGTPCPDCTGPDDYTNCVLCKGPGNPCNSCIEGGKYIPDSLCERGLWKFTDCKQNNDMVLNFSAPPGKTCADVTCGNCPWGGNDTSSILDFGPTKSLSCGSTNDSNYVCVSDNQIRLYEPSPKLSCDETHVPNNDKTACIYACTIDGTDARTYPNNDNEENIRKIFTAKKFDGDDTIYCFRKPLDENTVENMCKHSNDGFGTPYCNKGSQSLQYLTDNDYNYTDNSDNMCADLRSPWLTATPYWHDCAINLIDDIPKFTPLSDLEPPVMYLYPTDTSDWKHHGESTAPTPENQPLNCWSTAPPSSFWYSTNTGNSNFIYHPKIDFMEKSEFCSPLSFILPERKIN